DSSLTVTFEGTALRTSGTCTTDAKGNLPITNNCAFTVPPATAGIYNVTTSDGTYSGTTPFTVNPALSLTARAGAVGGGAAVSGSGFKANATITVTFDGNSVSTSCTTDATGSFSPCAFTAPAKTTGIHTVMASDGSANSATAIYTVTPAIGLNATAGTVGSPITLSGSNYTPNSTLTVTFDEAALRTSGICTTDASGNLPASNNCAFAVPAVPAGSYTVTVSDDTYSGSSTFTVNAALRLIPSAGPAGSRAAVNGGGFAPNAPITLSFDGSSVATICTADASGSFSSCAFTVPVTTAGIHPVTASDGPYSSTAIFTVGSALSLIPSAGAAGSRAAVNGSGFAPNAPITLSFDGSSVATSCTANASGSFSACTFTVPAAPAGPHTVTASDGTTAGTTSYTVK